MERRSLKKNQGFNGIQTRDLRVAGALLYQLSYEATHWERGQFIEFISAVRSEMMWSIWNNSFLNCGCRWKWRMIIAVNLALVSNLPSSLLLSSWFLKLPVKLCVLEASRLTCPLANETMRWTRVWNSQSSCFRRTGLLLPYPKFSPKGICCSQYKQEQNQSLNRLYETCFMDHATPSGLLGW